MGKILDGYQEISRYYYKGHNVEEQEKAVVSDIIYTIVWLETATKKDISEKLGKFYATDYDYSHVVRYYLSVQQQLRACNDLDAKGNLICSLINHELNLFRSNNELGRQYSLLNDKFCSNMYSDTSKKGSRPHAAAYITDIREVTDCEKRFINFIRADALDNLGDDIKMVLGGTFLMGFATLTIPGMFAKGVVPGVITTATIMAIMSVVNVVNYYSEWRHLLKENKEAIAVLQSAGVYEQVLEYLEECKKAERNDGMSIMRHHKRFNDGIKVRYNGNFGRVRHRGRFK